MLPDSYHTTPELQKCISLFIYVGTTVEIHVYVEKQKHSKEELNAKSSLGPEEECDQSSFSEENHWNPSLPMATITAGRLLEICSVYGSDAHHICSTCAVYSLQCTLLHTPYKIVI